MKSMFFRCAVLGVFLFLAGLIPAEARVITMTEAMVQFQVPDNWEIVEDAGNWLIQSPDGGGVSITFSLLPAQTVEEAARQCLQVVSDQVGTLKYSGELTAGELNGMNYVDQLATAMEGKMSVSMTLVQTPAKKWLMIAYLGSVEHESAWQNNVVAIAGSLRPIPARR